MKNIYGSSLKDNRFDQIYSIQITNLQSIGYLPLQVMRENFISEKSWKYYRIIESIIMILSCRRLSWNNHENI